MQVTGPTRWERKDDWALMAPTWEGGHRGVGIHHAAGKESHHGEILKREIAGAQSMESVVREQRGLLQGVEHGLLQGVLASGERQGLCE